MFIIKYVIQCYNVGIFHFPVVSDFPDKALLEVRLETNLFTDAFEGEDHVCQFMLD